MSTNCINCVVQPRTATDMLCDDCRREAEIRRMILLGPLDARWLIDRLDRRTREVEQLRAELVPVAYTKDHVPVRVGMLLHKVWQGHLKTGCAFFMVDMGGLYLDVTAAFSSEEAALAEDKE
jgi:hypothetical protein